MNTKRPFLRNKVRVALHVVWTTRKRRPMVTPGIERAIYRCIAAEAQALGCSVLALNGMSDHVHLVVTLPTTVCIAALVKQVKGVSSSLARNLLGHRTQFGWAEGYGVFSVTARDLPAVIAYVRNQKVHHATVDLWDEEEEPHEEAPDAEDAP